jgi:hypothetical protein
MKCHFLLEANLPADEREAIAYWKIAAASPLRSEPRFEWMSTGFGASLSRVTSFRN